LVALRKGIIMEQKQQEILECEGCGTPTPEKELTNVMAGVPLDIFAVCQKCLAKLEDEE
jgi:hypothetical protein